MALYPLQNAFNGGEVSPLFEGRTDHARYAASARTIENFVCQPLGGIARRPGTRFVAMARDQAAPVRLQVFEFNVEQAYVLEFGGGYIRFYRDGGRLEVGGVPVEVATPYGAADVFLLQFAQSADTLYIVHPAHAPRKLLRVSETAWYLRLVPFQPPPSVELDTALGVTLTLAAVGGSGVTATAGAAVFLDADVDRLLHSTNPALGEAGLAVVASLVGPSPAAQVTLNILAPFPTTTLAASDWALQGSPAASLTPSKSGPMGALVTLDLARATTTNPSLVSNGDFAAGTGSWTDKSTGSGTFKAPAGVAELAGGSAGVGWCQQAVPTTPSKKYHVQFDVLDTPLALQVGSTDGAADLLAEASYDVGNKRSATFTATGATSYVQWRQNQNQTAKLDNVEVTLSSAQGFRAADVGKYLKVNDGVVYVTAVPEPSQATGVVFGELSSTDAAGAGAWSLEEACWSGTRGNPRTVSFHKRRLAFAGSAAQPQTLWLSQVGQYERFAESALDDAALQYTLTANDMSAIMWIEPFKDLYCGTAGGEMIVQGGGGPLTPSNVDQVPQPTHLGSAPLRPYAVDNVLLLLQRGRRQLWELLYDDTGLARARDLTLTADHITSSGLVDLAMQRKPYGLLWGVRTDGVLVGCTYNYTEQVLSWHRHTTPGTFESVAVVPVEHPSDDATEQVWVAVRRATGRMIEVLTPGLAVDAGLSYSGPPVMTLTGLGHLEGQTVRVVGDGAVFPPLVVAGGQVVLPHAVSQADVGLGYLPRLVTMRPEVQTQQGTIQGRKKRWVRVQVRLVESVGLTIDGQRVPFRTPAMRQDRGIPADTLDTGTLTLGWSVDGRLTIEQPDPLPTTILALFGMLEVEDLP